MEVAEFFSYGVENPTCAHFGKPRFQRSLSPGVFFTVKKLKKKRNN